MEQGRQQENTLAMAAILAFSLAHMISQVQCTVFTSINAKCQIYMYGMSSVRCFRVNYCTVLSFDQQYRD